MAETHPVHVLFFSEVAQIFEEREKHLAVVPHKKVTESRIGATSGRHSDPHRPEVAAARVFHAID